MGSKSSVSLEPDTLNRFNGLKGLYQSQQQRTIDADEFVRHMLDLFELSQKDDDETEENVEENSTNEENTKEESEDEG